MTGYVRQTSFSDGDTIFASHANQELDALVIAMSAANGHKHDGSAGEGSFIPVISNQANTIKAEVTATGVEVTGDLTTTGSINGRDLSVDLAKLDTIESNATADMTGSEIKTAYEAEADTNAFTDAEKTKLSTVEANATADQTGAEIKTAYEAEADTNAFTDAEKTKLTGIEDNATADMTAGEIKTAYESNLDTNAFTDALKTKLEGITTGGPDALIANNNLSDLTDFESARININKTYHQAGDAATSYPGQRFGLDVSSGSITINLPILPSAGDFVDFVHYDGDLEANPVTIDRNGSTIMSLAENMTVDINNVDFGLIYNGTTWRVY